MNKEFQKKLNELSKLSGYEKPKKISGSLKLDSNENFVIAKQFQLDLIDAAKKRCDIRAVSYTHLTLPTKRIV